MASIIELNPRLRQQLITRLRRIEGQTQGVQRMLTEDRDCSEIMNQLASIRAAAHSASLILVKEYMLNRLQRCPEGSSEDNIDQTVAEILAVLSNAPY